MKPLPQQSPAAALADAAARADLWERENPAPEVKLAAPLRNLGKRFDRDRVVAFAEIARAWQPWEGFSSGSPPVGLATDKGERFPSQKLAAQLCGVHPNNICSAIAGRQPRAAGRKWRRLNERERMALVTELETWQLANTEERVA